MEAHSPVMDSSHPNTKLSDAAHCSPLDIYGTERSRCACCNSMLESKWRCRCRRHDLSASATGRHLDMVQELMTLREQISRLRGQYIMPVHPLFQACETIHTK